MSDVALLLVTFADPAEAERIARIVVEERLAACANLLGPCRSIYRWQDEVEQAEEVPALFKTSVACAGRLRERIVAMHSYDLPAIEIWPASAGPHGLKWIEQATT